MYSMDSLAYPYCYAAAMVCRLFVIPNSIIFSIEMVPLMEATINYFIMDWETILSDKMASKILDYRGTNFSPPNSCPILYESLHNGHNLF